VSHLSHFSQKAQFLNSLQDKGAGFASDTNKVTILDKRNNKTEFSLKSKYEIAEEIVLHIQEMISS
jgi:phosphopantothenoylcysteine decarboxylase/phosphopantothenate--cysteine ligase